MSCFWNRNMRDARRSYKPPIVLSPGMPLCLGIVLIILAIMYEVLFVVVMRKGGLGPLDQNIGIGHWKWSLPPVVIATAVSAAISSLYFNSQRMEPLADLAAGNSQPNKSLHLDYLSMALPLVFWKALTNRHRTVACTALMAILSLSLSSLSSTILVVGAARRPVPIFLRQMTELNINNSLNESLTDYAASAALTYATIIAGSSPPFTTRSFALPVFNTSDTPYSNASIKEPVTFQCQAIHSMANCEMATITSTTRINNTATKFMASGGGLPSDCTFNFTATPQLTYNTDHVRCSSFSNATYGPAAIWLGIDFPAGSTTASVHPINSTVAPINASVVICSPTLSIATVNVTMNANGIIDENNIQAYGQDSTFPPTGGRAFSGQSYPLDQLDARAQQRLENIRFQFTDAIYTAVIQGVDDPERRGFDIQDQLLITMGDIYQLYASISAWFVFFVDTNNGSIIVGTSDVPQSYLFISTPSVHILACILTSLAISSLLVAYQLHHKHNHDGFAHKLAAITTSPFTLAGATSMSAGQLWGNEAAAPCGGTVCSFSGARAGNIGGEENIPPMAASKQDMIQRLAQYTYTLDWSGKVVQHTQPDSSLSAMG